MRIAPRVIVYPHGTPSPPVEEGWLTLPQLPPPVLESGRPHAGVGPAPSGAVFGDGAHPTTRLCAAAVDLICRQRPGMSVLDVGTGTGILARIARARGATFVAGTDIDPAAVVCAQSHAELDTARGPNTTAGHCAAGGTVSPSATPIASGARTAAHDADDSGATIHFGCEAPDHWGARFDLVVANILEAPLKSLAPALSRALRPGGVLLISGFTRPQVPALRLVYEATGLTSHGVFTKEDWVLLKFA